MTKEEIKNSIIDVLAKIALDKDVQQLDPEIPLRTQLELDSLDFVNLILDLGNVFKIKIPKDDLPELATLNKAIDYLYPMLKDRSAPEL